jgi:hypothetical protein
MEETFDAWLDGVKVPTAAQRERLGFALGCKVAFFERAPEPWRAVKYYIESDFPDLSGPWTPTVEEVYGAWTDVVPYDELGVPLDQRLLGQLRQASGLQSGTLEDIMQWMRSKQ